MSELRFTKEHEWIRLGEDGIGTVGISDYAQGQLGDMVFIDLPAIGTLVQAGRQSAVAESVKAASEIYSPATGEVVAINTAINDTPAVVNQDPHGDGWLYRLRLDNPAELADLMDQAAYDVYIEGLG